MYSCFQRHRKRQTKSPDHHRKRSPEHHRKRRKSYETPSMRSHITTKQTRALLKMAEWKRSTLPGWTLKKLRRNIYASTATKSHSKTRMIVPAITCAQIGGQYTCGVLMGRSGISYFAHARSRSIPNILAKWRTLSTLAPTLSNAGDSEMTERPEEVPSPPMVRILRSLPLPLQNASSNNGSTRSLTHYLHVFF